MPKYLVTAYSVIGHSIEVEAPDADTAEDIGRDKIENGLGESGEPVWQDEVDVDEVIELDTKRLGT